MGAYCAGSGPARQCKAPGLEFGVEGLIFGVWVMGFRCLGFRDESSKVLGLEFRVEGFIFNVWVLGFRFLGFRDESLKG